MPDDRSTVRAAVPHPVFDVEDLPRTAYAHEFVGFDHGDVPFSVILVDAPPGQGPALHRHPYAEVFLVEEGSARFEVDGAVFEAHAGQVVVGAPDVPHGFRNDGPDRLRVTAIHGAGRFETDWLSGEDRVWASKPKG